MQDASEELSEGKAAPAPESSKDTEFQLARYVDVEFESEEIKHLIRDRIEPPMQFTDAAHKYRTSDVLPNWIMKTKDWKMTKGKNDGTDISEILQTLPNNRSLEQSSQLVHFLMDVWQTAKQMGIKKCTQMLNEFKYVQYKPKEYIITEGEEGMTFYIIISGTTAVHKGGIGVVAHLGKGKAFGELALVKGDVRTASIIAETPVEVISLHKLDYDHFIKDIQTAERRENFYLLRDCSLFLSWPRAKIEKMVNTCQRKVIEAGGNIYKQGDDPDSIFVVMDGTVHVIKEVIIQSKNMWPTGMNSWQGLTRKVMKPILTNTLHKGGHFGELAIVKGTPRLDTAIASTKCLLVQLDKLEFLHLVHHDAQISNQLQQSTLNNKYPVDNQILKLIGHLSGGPMSQATSGELTIYPNKVVPLKSPPKLSNERPSAIFNRKMKKKAEKDKMRVRRDLMEDSYSTIMGTYGNAEVGKDNYAEKMSSALAVDTLVAGLTSHVLKVGNTVERQAMKELKAANEVLRSATTHKEIDTNPLRNIPHVHHRGTAFNLAKMKSMPKEKKGPTVLTFEQLEMKEASRQTIRSPDGRRDPLLSYVISKQGESPGISVRRLKGDEFNPTITVKKREPKPAQAFI